MFGTFCVSECVHVRRLLVAIYSISLLTSFFVDKFLYHKPDFHLYLWSSHPFSATNEKVSAKVMLS